MHKLYTFTTRRISLHLARRSAPYFKPATTLQQHFRSTAFIMSSDQDYASFLEKANQDVGSHTANTSSSKDNGFLQTKAVDTSVPSTLKNLDAFYVSESDEPFEPVAIKHAKDGELSKDVFAKLIHHSGEVEEESLESWNVKGQYDTVIDAVKNAASGSKGDVKVFRVSHDKTRCEYYIVTLSDGAMVGVKARAVET